MTITTSTIITLGSLLTAIAAIFAWIFKVHKWFLKQEEQEKRIKSLEDKHNEDTKEIRTEQRVMCTGVLACLDGLEQLGCNHSVPKAKEMLEEYLNNIAHQ